MIASYTNSCLSCFRRCPREYELRYLRQLERAGDEREVLQVGTTWHKAHDASSIMAAKIHPANPHEVRGDPRVDGAAYQTIAAHAPGAAWNEKLRRLFGAYRWKWSGTQEFKMIHSEHTFTYVDGLGRTRRGQIDGIVEIDGAIGNLERKTSGEDLSDGSSYWERQRMGTQVSFYANAFKALTGKAPEFTLYDVVRKPTIRAKNIVKKDMVRLRAELDQHGFAMYYGEKIRGELVEEALAAGRETLALYGARLTADIGDRPEWYFQRKIIPRTSLDLQLADQDTDQTINYIEQMGAAQEAMLAAGSTQSAYPRNPDACPTFGLCDFFGVCSNGEYPAPETVPAGLAKRRHLHIELEDLSV